MSTLWAHETTSTDTPTTALLFASGRPEQPDRGWFEASAGRRTAGRRSTAKSLPCPKTVPSFTGHLGVLPQAGPAPERQRRYDFWFKQP